VLVFRDSCNSTQDNAAQKLCAFPPFRKLRGRMGYPFLVGDRSELQVHRLRRDDKFIANAIRQISGGWLDAEEFHELLEVGADFEEFGVGGCQRGDSYPFA
jgi:hypothetical protein